MPQYSGESKAQKREEKELIFHPLKRLWGPPRRENCYSSSVCVVGDGNSLSLFSICDTLSEPSVQVAGTALS